MKKWLLIAGCFLTCTVFAETGFIIKHIYIRGLQGLSYDTVISNLSLKVGDRFIPQKTPMIIHRLYKTGFFDSISVLQQKPGTLIIQVVQRPIISNITMTGNKTLPRDKLMETLKNLGFAEGQVFNKALLAKIQTSLAREYFRIGKYNTVVQTETQLEERHRIRIHLSITEGKTAKIKHITLIGNHRFNTKKLLSQFKSSPSHLLSFMTQNDQYSREKLEADLETLRSYYMDRGYIQFTIESTQVSISPDRNDVYITLQISEGAQYHFGKYTFAGQPILPIAQLKTLTHLKTGDVFSREILMHATQQITAALGNQGYAQAAVKIIPKINDSFHTVDVTLKIDPKQQMTIHRITFSDHYRTNDETLRRELQQKEGALFSAVHIESSKRSLLLLPFIRNVEVTTTPVESHPNQLDLNYKVTEHSAAELKAGLAYSQLNKFMFNMGLTHRNILGTGKSVGLNFNRSRPSTNFDFNYYNPYYTTSGIGRSLSVYATQFNASKANITNYATNEYGLAVGYHFPLSQFNSVQLGYGYENTYLSIGNTPSQEMSQFVEQHGRHFYNLKFNIGWERQGLNRALFPTQGTKQSLSLSTSVPISNNSLEYYRMGYAFALYHPLNQYFIGQFKGNIGYGDGYGHYAQLPFFKNLFAGGVGSVRGYAGNTLGPKDSNGSPLGNNVSVNGTLGLIFPNPLGETVRTTLFVDGGNADLHSLRYAAGVELDWLSPIGILNFSLAKALNLRHGDETEVFQFTVGTSF